MKKQNKKIMVAEDDEGILDVVKTILEMHKYDVVVATDYQSIKNIKDGLPDLLLLDVWMGKLDGRKICKYLKSRPETNHIPIIMFSATKDLENSAKQAGADDFLEKPFEINNFISKIKKHLH